MGVSAAEYRRLSAAQKAAAQAADKEEAEARLAEEAVLRKATRHHLVREGVPDETADAWLDEWVRQAYRDPPTRPDGRFWDDAWEWIAADRSFRSHPSSWDHRMPDPDNDRVWVGAVLWICVVVLTALLGVVLLVVFLAVDLPAMDSHPGDPGRGPGRLLPGRRHPARPLQSAGPPRLPQCVGSSAR